MAPRKSDDPAASRRSESLPPAKVRDAKISKSPHSASTSRPKRPPGRPFKTPSRSNSSQSRSGRSERPSASPGVAPIPSPTPPRRTLSMLEALPVEIIEQIFLYCLNLNLPRASRVLGTALSRERLYKVLIILAFWDDPISKDQNPRSEAIDKVFLPLEYVPLSLERRRTLQEQVFRCKWCTRERIQEQTPQMMNLTIQRRWINAGITLDPPDQQAHLDRFMAREDNKARVYYGIGPPSTTAAQPLHTPRPRESEPSVLHRYEMHIKPNGQLKIRSVPTWESTSWPALGLLTFPSHLLRGRSTGFTEEDVLFLEMLRMCSYDLKVSPGGVGPETKATFDREALHDGVQNAIRTQNLDALTTLVKIDEFIFRFSTASTGYSSLPFYAIPSHHFITAIQYGCDNPIRSVAVFEALIRASAESLPMNPRPIIEWIIKTWEDIARKGLEYPEVNTRLLRWLSDFVLRLPSHIEEVLDDPSKQIFYCGSVLGMESDAESDEEEGEAQRFIDAVLKPERDHWMGYLPDSPYNPADYWLSYA